MLLSIVLGCKTKQDPINFMLLEKHSGKTPITYKVVDGKVKDIYIYIETYLVDNLPKRNKDVFIDDNVYNIQLNFFKNNNEICLLEDDINSYIMGFYRRSPCTEYFIDNYEDRTGISQTTFSDCEDDIEFVFNYERNKKNPNMWTNNEITKYWGEKYSDTIYCISGRKKVKLPDMPHN
ncbi:hypothetical protein A8C32_03745 [Flavivirga aquatica]|uniref:Uncharacterized protein n=2 Tax=Flavivirga aquatica TaxID=1849968 RepID=A0A1E5TB16_9FLAO|nr:hypothetical protein A8C32_03745 [Flavivirga aquatica]